MTGTEVVSSPWSMQSLVPMLQTVIVATFGYVAKLLRDIRKEVAGLREDIVKIDRKYEKHEVKSVEVGLRVDERFREHGRRLDRLERVPQVYGGNGEA